MARIPVEVLTEEYRISYAPSGTLFAHSRQQPSPGRTGASTGLFALADPDFNRPAETCPWLEKFERCPGTRLEVETIARLFDRPLLLFGSEASEQNLEHYAADNWLRRYRYLHLATHGKADPERGLRSYLALAQDRLRDPREPLAQGEKLYEGKLRAEQIQYHWKLDADLVTLSACETGLGEHKGSEGYIGFAQALLLAGARSLVLSQWKVDDQATALLMVRFYQNLLGKRPGLEQPMPKASALAEAKHWLRTLPADEVDRLARDLSPSSRAPEVSSTAPVRPRPPTYAHPHYWAGFILIGDPGDVSQAIPVLAELSQTEATPTEVGARLWPWLAGGAVVLVGMGGVWRWRRGRVV
jgi:CHAT domain-containing protein